MNHDFENHDYENHDFENHDFENHDFENHIFEGVGKAGEHKEGWIHNHTAGGGHKGSAGESAGDLMDLTCKTQGLPIKRTLP